MLLKLEPRLAPSRAMVVASPIIAVLATIIVGAIAFTLLGFDGLGAVQTIFLSPLASAYRWQDMLVKAAPLAIIATGLSIGFRANVWNIGAEGQYILGGLAATGVALATHEMTGSWILPLMILAGILGGMAWAGVPALLRTRLGVNEILSSLMLNYVAIQLLYYLMRGPWKDPMGFNFPQTVLFSADQTLPIAIAGTLVHIGVPIAAALALTAAAFAAVRWPSFGSAAISSAVNPSGPRVSTASISSPPFATASARIAGVGARIRRKPPLSRIGKYMFTLSTSTNTVFIIPPPGKIRGADSSASESGWAGFLLQKTHHARTSRNHRRPPVNFCGG